MVTLKGEKVYLRALEPEDLDFLYNVENDTSIWELSDTQTPYSRFLIKQYLENAHLDIYEAKQLRLVVCLNSNTKVIGLIDLFDFNFKNKRAGVGILINKEFRDKGIGFETLKLIIDYSFSTLHLNQLYANVSELNLHSLHVFQKLNFQKVGLKKDWVFNGESYENQYLLQLINK